MRFVAKDPGVDNVMKTYIFSRKDLKRFADDGQPALCEVQYYVN